MFKWYNIIIYAVITVGSITLIVINSIQNSDFLDVSIIDIITFLLTFFIVVFLVMYQSSFFKLKEKYEQILEKFQIEIGIDLQDYSEEDAHIMILKHNKKVGNLFTLLKTYSERYKVKNLIDELDKYLDDYQDYLSKHIGKKDQIDKHEYDRLIQNIDNKCNQISFQLYKKL